MDSGTRREVRVVLEHVFRWGACAVRMLDGRQGTELTGGKGVVNDRPDSTCCIAGSSLRRHLICRCDSALGQSSMDCMSKVQKGIRTAGTGW